MDLSTMAIGGVNFGAVRKESARGLVYWVCVVVETGEEQEQEYSTRPKMWEDLKRAHMARGDKLWVLDNIGSTTERAG